MLLKSGMSTALKRHSGNILQLFLDGLVQYPEERGAYTSEKFIFYIDARRGSLEVMKALQYFVCLFFFFCFFFFFFFFFFFGNRFS